MTTERSERIAALVGVEKKWLEEHKVWVYRWPGEDIWDVEEPDFDSPDGLALGLEACEKRGWPYQVSYDWRYNSETEQRQPRWDVYVSPPMTWMEPAVSWESLAAAFWEAFVAAVEAQEGQ